MSPRRTIRLPPAHLGAHGTEHCVAAREVLNRVGDTWSMFIVRSLRDGPIRFNALKRGVEGISQRMLTLTLKGLVRDGLVTRTVTPSVPPRVDYALTELGRTLIEPVEALSQWAFQHGADIARARQQFDGAEKDVSPRRLRSSDG